jgi:pilus assembly protein CpaC
LATRRVQTEIELENGQSFVIAGLLNNQVTDQFSKMPGFANVPILGKLFQSKSVSKSSSELLIMVTPELVNPLPAGGKTPEMPFPKEFIKDGPTRAPQQPSGAGTENTPLLIKRDVIPIEDLLTTPQGTTSSNMTPPASNLPGASGVDQTRSTGKP